MRFVETVGRLLIGVALVAAVAGIVIHSQSERKKESVRHVVPGRAYSIGIVYLAPGEGVDLCIRGLLEGLASEGFVEGRNLAVRRAHAQGRVGQLPALLESFDSHDLDAIVAMSAPSLAAACRVVKRKPVTFAYVHDPVAAGAGKSSTEHLPHVTGVGSSPDPEETLRVIRQLAPGVKRIGVLYGDSGASSGAIVAAGREACRKLGLEVEEIAVTGAREARGAARELAARKVQALWVAGGGTSLEAFSAVAGVARDRRLPVVVNDSEFVGKGALAAVGIGWYGSGFEGGKITARVLRGEKPAAIPMVDFVDRTVSYNPAVARSLGIALPGELP